MDPLLKLISNLYGNVLALQAELEQANVQRDQAMQMLAALQQQPEAAPASMDSTE